MPQVSVIIPNYNHAPFLVQRIESVLNQNFQDFEVIILDDCSPDHSRDIIETYRNHPKVVHIEYNTQNSGSPFKQWNKGINLAKGEYIWIAESDDWADERFLEVLVGNFSNNKNIGLAYCDSLEITEKNEEIGRWSRWQKLFCENIWQSDFTKKGIEINNQYNNLYNIIPNASSALFSKLLYINSKYKHQIESYKYTGDWWMWFSILEKSDVYYFHTPLNYFRCHSNTTRADNTNNKLKAFEYYKAISNFNKSNFKNISSAIYHQKMIEIFEIWNLSVKSLFLPNNLKVLFWAYRVDSKIFSKILKLTYTRIFQR